MQTLSPNLINRTSGALESKSTEDDLPSISQSPVLQAALVGLDVALDDELERYRHWQGNGQTFSYLNPFKPFSQSIAQVVDRSAHQSVNYAGTSPELPTMPVMPAKLMPLPTGRQTERQLERQTPKTSENSSFLATLSNSGQDSAAGSEPINSATRAGFASVNQAMNQVVNEDDLMRDMAENYGEQEVSATTSGSAGFNLVSPFGIASLLLLLLASAVVGYLVVDPSGLTKLLQKQDQQTMPKKSSYLPSDSSGEIDLTNNQNMVGNQDNLLVDPKNLSLPFVPLPGDASRPGQTADRFTGKELPIKVKNTNPTNDSTKVVKALRPNRNIDLSTPPLASAPLREVPSSSYQSLPSFSAPPAYDPPAQPRYTPSSTPSYKPSRSTARALPQRRLPNRNIPSGLILPPLTASQSRKYEVPIAIAPPVSSRSAITRIPNVPASGQSVRSIQSQPISQPNIPVQYGAPISAPAPTASTTSGDSGGYRLVVRNNYLNQAQQIEKEAFIRNDNNVQLGSYRDANTAQQRALELRNQGLPVEIVPR